MYLTADQCTNVFFLELYWQANIKSEARVEIVVAAFNAGILWKFSSKTKNSGQRFQ